MPDLASLTDVAPQPQPVALPVAQPQRVYITLPDNTQPPAPIAQPDLAVPASLSANGSVGTSPVGVETRPEPTTLGKIYNKLTGSDGEERYQTWPEKVVREALAAPHDVMTGATPQYAVDPVTGDVHTSPQMIEGAQAVSALAGSGGVAGVEEGAGSALGATPFLRPALKYGDKIYKAPINGQHLDALPAHLADTFQKQAMSGEDISNFNFGFMNHKGQFLDREKALDYAVKEGLVDPSAGQYGSLTSTLLADSSKPGTAIEAMAKTGSPFYSALEHNVNQISQAKMTGDQWLGTLANKPGVKPEEMDWTGVKDFLKERGDKPVTKAELQEHLQNNKVSLSEVEKGHGEYHYIQQKSTLENHLRYFDSILPEFKTVDDVALAKQHNSPFRETVKGYSDKEVFDAIQEAKKPISSVFHGSSERYDTKAEAEAVIKAAKLENHMHVITEQNIGTKYHSYQLPGGENYREMLMTLPSKPNAATYNIVDKSGKVLRTTTDKTEADALAGIMPGTEVKSIAKYDTNAYKSSHWDEPNILAHVRMNDRTIDGKKSLHLEEIQSDWHQQGREHGYSEKSKNSETDELYRQLGGTKKTPVPDAPFKKTWHELALKRMIREAAEKGYDRLSWTPGEAQAARYDLSKSVDRFTYDKDGILAGYDKKGSGQRVIEQKATESELPDLIGKEAAEKLIKMKPDEYGNRILENQDLKIGGEGMKGFYDQIIPKALSKISGEKVKTAGLGTENKSGKVVPFEHGEGFRIQYANGSSKIYKTKAEAEAKLASENVGPKVHYIDIPQALKDKAMQKGFPLFSGNYMYTPVAGDPFKKKKSK